MKITFLGTADAFPTANRNHSAILFSYDGENILVDCGEGTQRQFRKVGISPTKITRLLISHWHGDHVLGIPGLLQTLAFQGYNKTLYIYGPKGTKKFIEEIQKVFVYQEHAIRIKVEEVGTAQCTPNCGIKGQKFFETNDFYLEAKSMAHGIPCNAYCFVKKGQLRIDKKKLKKSRIPSGPLLAKIKQGKSISYNGKKYSSRDLTYQQGETKISFVLDTKLNNSIVPFVKNSDILITEASFSDELKEKAKEHLHLTAKQAGEIAKESNSKKLILTHISQRYEKNLDKILNEAKKVFKNSSVVNDLDVVEV